MHFSVSVKIGILLAYTLSMRDIGKLHSEIGLIVEVLKQVRNADLLSKLKFVDMKEILI